MIEIQATGNTTLHTAGKYVPEDILVKVPEGGTDPVLQNKTITPTANTQIINADSGYDGLDTVTVSAIPSTYVEPTSTKTATTYTPTTSNQTIAAGTYCSGAQTIAGDANLVAENIAEGVSIFGITGTHSGGSDGGGTGNISTCSVTINFPGLEDVEGLVQAQVSYVAYENGTVCLRDFFASEDDADLDEYVVKLQDSHTFEVVCNSMLIVTIFGYWSDATASDAVTYTGDNTETVGCLIPANPNYTVDIFITAR